jgi:hypothetical protein
MSPYSTCLVGCAIAPTARGAYAFCLRKLFVAWYNFALKHERLRGKTPAMASQLTDHVWTIKELIERAA